MLPSRLKCDRHTQTHTDVALLQFISLCLPPALLLRTAFEFGQFSLCAQSSLTAPGTEWMKGRWVKGGEGKTIWERGEEESVRWRAVASFAVLELLSSFFFFFSEQICSSERGAWRGGSTANLYYICFIHVVDSRVISVYDHWTMADCSVWEKGKQHPPVNPHHSILQPQSSALFLFFASWCFLTFTVSFCLFLFFFAVCLCLNLSSPPILFSPQFSFSFYLPPTAPPNPVSCWWLSRIETGHLRSLQWHWEAQLPRMCVCHTLSSSPVQQRPHRIYVPRCQSHSDPRDFLIINSNLNLTSNADPRDNIVVTISTHKNWLQVLWLSSVSLFLP